MYVGVGVKVGIITHSHSSGKNETEQRKSHFLDFEKKNVKT